MVLARLFFFPTVLLGFMAWRHFYQGARLFEVRCAACHAGFGNTMDPDRPIRGSRQLADFAVFRDFVRHPRLPEGSRGAMPGFTPAQISDSQMRELYQYLISQVGK
jgi:mono/diheme cytochrome c family protein